jgi:TRAP-type C4-dicarboxylate transport system permease small subunit
MLTKFISLLNRFSEICHDIGTIVFIPIMIAIVSLNVVLRYFFNAPLSWGEEMNGMLLFLVLFLSMTYAWDQKKHIRMEIVYVLFKGVWRSLADLIAGICGIIFFSMLAVQCFRDMPYMIKTSESSDVLMVPLWPFRALMALISIIFVIKLVIYIFHERKEIAKEETVIVREDVVISKGGK